MFQAFKESRKSLSARRKFESPPMFQAFKESGKQDRRATVFPKQSPAPSSAVLTQKPGAEKSLQTSGFFALDQNAGAPPPAPAEKLSVHSSPDKEAAFHSAPGDAAIEGKKPPMRITSDNKSLEKELRSVLQSAPEKSVKEKIMGHLIREGYFRSQIVRSPQGFFIKNPYQMIFILKGNRFFNDFQLKGLIRSYVESRKAAEADEIVSFLKAAYREKGFHNIQVERRKTLKGFQEWIYLTLHEGSRIQIAEIQFKGLFSRPAAFYSRLLRKLAPPLIRQGRLSLKDFQTARKNFIFHLKTQGYLQAALFQDRIVYKNDKAYITVNFNEGPLTMIKTIAFSGNKAFSHAFLAAKMKSGIFQPLLMNILEKDIFRIEQFYKDQGFLGAKILNKRDIIRYDKDASYAHIQINIQEGVKSYISEVVIQGAERTQESFIRKIIQLKQGEALTEKKIRTARSALLALGVFSKISFDFEPRRESRILLSLKEKKPRLLRVRAGLNSERGVTSRAHAEITHRNLFGRGGSLFGKTGGQMSFPGSIFEYELSGVYQELLRPESGIRGYAGLSRSRSLFAYTPEGANGVLRNKVRFSLEHKKSSLFSVRWHVWNFEGREEFCIKKICSPNFQGIGSMGFHMSYDQRDHIFNPSKGFLMSLSASFAAPFMGGSKNIQFSKIGFQNRFYIPLPGGWTLASDVRGGLIFSSKSIPVSRSFILGGPSTVRGYDGHIEGERIPGKDKFPFHPPMRACVSKRAALCGSLNTVF